MPSPPTFAVGTGRCGTRFLYELMNKSKEVTAFHEQHPVSDTFLRYITWYQLSIDTEGCWVQKERVVKNAQDSGKQYVESSAYLSLNVLELFQRFDAKFILLIRHPKDVVDSYFAKGWYENPVIRNRPEQPPSIQPDLKLPHHNFTRIVAYGEEGNGWNQLTQVGKLAWYWKMINEQVIKAFDKLPHSQYLTVRLEDFTFEKYLEICDFAQVTPSLRERKFNRIARMKPNRRKNTKLLPDWSMQEKIEFSRFVSPLAKRFEYHY